jgi:hypothetical protein
VQAVLILAMFAGMFAFLIFWMLLWAGLPVERLACVSIGVAITATGLILIGESLRPRWMLDYRWNPRPRRRVVVPGRLTSLGFGIAFCVHGVVFLAATFLGDGELPGLAVSAYLGALAAAVVLMVVGHRYDLRRAEAVRAAVRRRGWLMASRREDDDRPAEEAQLRQAREEQRQSIQRNLTGRTTPERTETQHRYLVDIAGSGGSPKDRPEVAEEWQAFRSGFAEGDEIWGFNTVSVRFGLASGEEGFARLRHGAVVDWFITAVVG